MKKSIIIKSLTAILLIGGLILGFDGCKKTKSHTAQEPKTEDSTQVVDSLEATTPTEAPTSIRVFFDNSASMAGYLVKGKRDYNTLYNAIVALGRNYGNGVYAFTADLCCAPKGKTPQKGISYEQFKEMIDNAGIAAGSESLLNKIIGDIAEETKAHPNQLSIFFTDGIISGPAEKITADREYTTNHIEDLSGELSNAVRNKGLAASVYRFDKADFNGAYYSYDNKPKNMKGSRPIYVVALGSPKEIAKFKEWTESSEATNFQPSQVVHIGTKLPISSGLINPDQGIKNGVVEYKPSDINSKFDGLFTFKLPYSVFSDIYEKNYNFAALKDKVKVSIDGIEIPAVENDKNGNSFETVEAGQDGFIIKVRARALKNNAKMNVMIPYSQPEWIALYSTRDDRTSLSSDNTYMLDKFVGAIVNGISGDSKAETLFSQTVDLKKK
ncbi:MAG: hypothetical protein J1F38_00640 [Muribaculaceae bacterium]|nr:hypothetical protein [Muribaculaceae bacterium]